MLHSPQGAMTASAEPAGRAPVSAGLRARLLEQLHRSGRYTAVSVVCALLHNGIMIGLDRLGVHYVWCQTASEVVLLPTGYLLQGAVTFRAKRNWRDFFRYSGALLTNFPVAIAILWLLCDVLALDMLWAAPISMVLLFIWNYLASAWAFSRRRGAIHG